MRAYLQWYIASLHAGWTLASSTNRSQWSSHEQFILSQKIANVTEFLLIMSHTCWKSRVVHSLAWKAQSRWIRKKAADSINHSALISSSSPINSFRFLLSFVCRCLNCWNGKSCYTCKINRKRRKHVGRKNPFKSSCHSNGAAKDEKSLDDFVASCDKLNFCKSSQALARAQALEIASVAAAQKLQ